MLLNTVLLSVGYLTDFIEIFRNALSTCNNDYLLNELSHILCKFLVNLSFCAANDLLLKY